MSKRAKLHYGWLVSFAGLLIMGAATGIYNATLGVFVKPVCEDLGFLRGQFTLTGSISIIIAVVLMPFFGSIFQKYGFRRIALAGTVVIGLALYGQSVSGKLWHFYLCSSLVGICLNTNGIMAVGILVNRWFVDKKGLATGIAFAGSGVLPAIVIPMANRFVELYGWRWTYRFVSSVSLAILLPVILFVVKDKPEDAGLEPYRDKAARPEAAAIGGLTRGEALRSPVFWLLAAVAMGVTLAQAGANIHTISFMRDLGYSVGFASTIAAVFLISNTAFKILIGMVLDRLGSKAALLFGVSCILFPAFALFAKYRFVPFAYAIFLSLATAGATILNTFLTAEYFGRKDFSRIYSLVSMFSYMGMVISFPGLGFVYDVTGSYSYGWYIIMAIGTIVCVSLLAAEGINRKTAPVKS